MAYVCVDLSIDFECLLMYVRVRSGCSTTKVRIRKFILHRSGHRYCYKVSILQSFLLTLIVILTYAFYGAHGTPRAIPSPLSVRSIRDRPAVTAYLLYAALVLCLLTD